MEKLTKIKDLINSEGSVLSLHKGEKKLYLCSLLSENMGNVYYSVLDCNLEKYINGEITLNEVYNLTDDFIIKFKKNGNINSYFKEDFFGKLELGEEYYTNLPSEIK